MKIIPLLAISFLVAILASAIGIISVQNAAPVALSFILFKSIQIPVGLVLAMSISAGLIGGAVLQPLWNLSDSQDSRPRFQANPEDSDTAEY
ncbi:MAG: LapA family protein [Microcoleus sp. PH2017_15_JOR_U_A]|uniref:LapA family protein n=1 Tax=unclassified Microcoleus TaxID=2642155 RepID=UPI001DF0CC5D|nr:MULTISPECIES: LapA family protein [unclassified Microcoleus]TAG04629.1 MAG: LapA family protein [Oscillatoriales cyanobacterium]MCC3438470.1 LapA family protein [Microcoleus sp. PH2017_05_CCC_O_A]MCC3495200.1 LapA family protein [Microcoleus sp. PH2017_15_JOR_U_A]MCC3595276.1 LapA family protein [Microcoleus sp. PH2017_26_ELK_O_A]MCC3620469.1 LapA family protein [Microcoleus sp. PH2017_36_ELK_O_B]